MATEEVDEFAYRPRYVAFVDVLGFSALVRAGDTDPAIRQLILGIVAILRETLARNPRVGFQFTQFSDCIVMSANCNAFGLHAIFSGCRMLAMNLLSHGILLRGGIAMGNLTHTDRELFGVGLVVAHGFDKSGGSPRIALDPNIVAEISAYGADMGLEEQVRIDPADQTAMLHTLLEFEEYDPTPAVGKVALDRVAAQIAQQISLNVSGSMFPDAVAAKWQWFRDYWNRSVATKQLLAAAE